MTILRTDEQIIDTVIALTEQDKLNWQQTDRGLFVAFSCRLPKPVDKALCVRRTGAYMPNLGWETTYKKAVLFKTIKRYLKRKKIADAEEEKQHQREILARKEREMQEHRDRILSTLDSIEKGTI